MRLTIKMNKNYKSRYFNVLFWVDTIIFLCSVFLKENKSVMMPAINIKAAPVTIV